MSAAANGWRGEVALGGRVLRPSFAALVAAEGELGPLFPLVERASEGRLTLSETVALLHHCCTAPDVARADFAEELAALGLAAVQTALRAVLVQVLKGR